VRTSWLPLYIRIKSQEMNDKLPSGAGNANAQSSRYSFPGTPFESIGFALSGGGFRAATFGLGILSLMDHVKWEEEGGETSLLKKVRFVSSASGGSITLSVYLVALYQGKSFIDFYHHLNKKVTGEEIVHKAMGILKDPDQWKGEKSRNIINAFSRAYHETLFNSGQQDNPTLGSIMSMTARKEVHVDEFCFNSTEFYTGKSFRFQGGSQWKGNAGGRFGNHDIEINWTSEGAKEALARIRLSDVLAASSCFPAGFEPIIFPRDFSYEGGPSVTALKEAINIKPLSLTPDQPKEKVNSRAIKEEKFIKAKEIGLMDGGIVDNLGLQSLLEANKRIGKKRKASGEDHRFDLMVVNDVTSFFMSPYIVPEIETSKEWMKRSPEYYWKWLRNMASRVKKRISLAFVLSIIFAVLFALPLIFEGVTVAGVVLAVVGVLLFVAGFILKTRTRKIFKKPIIKSSLKQKTLSGLVGLHMKEDSFTRRTALLATGYLQSVQLGVLLQMVNARVRSSLIMVLDVFLKHIRRLSYDLLFKNSRYIYRRMDNILSKLTVTNNIRLDFPDFEPPEEEDDVSYKARRDEFRDEVTKALVLSDEMKDTAELAYQTGTTLWFETEQEQEVEGRNNRKALIATGQFTACYNFLAYSLMLRHSRHFNTLESKYQQRINTVIDQLKALMCEFNKDPYYLYNLLGKDIPTAAPDSMSK
jgi:hypothetical protein